MSEPAKVAPLTVLCLALMIILVTKGAFAQEGRFVGELILRDNDPRGGRNFELIEPFGYIDPNGVRWEAEKGLVTDGASIPQVFWSFLGGPYEGLYRRAAIVHDFYCDRKYRPWERVHRVFYDAMLTGGVGLLKAKLMYYAVWRFGPRWSVSEIIPCVPNPAIGKYCADSRPIAIQFTSERPAVDGEIAKAALHELEDFAARIEREDVTVEQIQALAESKPALLRQRTFVHQDLVGPNAISVTPFEGYKILEQSTPLPLPQELPNLFPSSGR